MDAVEKGQEVMWMILLIDNYDSFSYNLRNPDDWLLSMHKLFCIGYACAKNLTNRLMEK